MRADEDGPGICIPREPSIRIVLDRLVTVEFRPSSTRTPASLDGFALRDSERLPMPTSESASF